MSNLKSLHGLLSGWNGQRKTMISVWLQRLHEAKVTCAVKCGTRSSEFGGETPQPLPTDSHLARHRLQRSESSHNHLPTLSFPAHCNLLSEICEEERARGSNVLRSDNGRSPSTSAGAAIPADGAVISPPQSSTHNSSRPPHGVGHMCDGLPSYFNAGRLIRNSETDGEFHLRHARR